MNTEIMMESNCTGLGEPKRGKVRDIYDLGDTLLIVTTDRISAFDHILPNGIPGKGEVLNQISAHWFKTLAEIIPNHMLTCDPAQYPKACRPYSEQLQGRSMLVVKAEPLPVECVVRGYLAGSGWKDYKRSGQICGVRLPPGMVESQEIEPAPIFTPATKAQIGDHDENIPFRREVDIVGEFKANLMAKTSFDLYRIARGLARAAGIIIGDTKFEFGIGPDGRLILIDEVLTPDSSRFWPTDQYKPGGSQPSFDKQFVRDYLEILEWDKRPPAPRLPEDVVKKTAEKYQEARRLLLAPLPF